MAPTAINKVNAVNDIIWGNKNIETSSRLLPPSRSPVSTDPSWNEMADLLQDPTLGHVHDGVIGALLPRYVSLSNPNPQIPSQEIILKDDALGYAKAQMRFANSTNSFYTELSTLGFGLAGPVTSPANIGLAAFNDLSFAKLENLVEINISKPAGFAGDSNTSVYFGDDGRVYGGFGWGMLAFLNAIQAKFYQSTVDPLTTDIPSGFFTVWKNTTSGSLRVWANDGGVMKSVALA